MEETSKTLSKTPPTELTADVKRELMSDVVKTQQRVDSVQARTEMTPSGHDDFSVWIPFPVDQPVVPEAAIPAYSGRRLDPLEWVELLEQTECLEYVSPDVKACIENQRVMEGNQELELTGREFIESPDIPPLPPLNSLSEERSTTLRPIAPSKHNLPRRPGLREKFPRQHPPTECNQSNYARNYLACTESPARAKRPTRSSSSILKRRDENLPQRSASRSLKFEATYQPKPTTRRKRSSWSGRSTHASTQALTRRQCKSARKSKDCMIPGCTKGARSRGLCKRHGGGKRCTHPGCARSDQGGGFCIAHGGGKRCATEGCKNSAQSRGLCKTHGGGKRCRADGCTKSSQGGGFCRGHGASKAPAVEKVLDMLF